MLFKADNHNDYFHFYRLSVEAAAAMGGFWRHIIRKELNIIGEDAPEISGYFRQQYQGERYSFLLPRMSKF